MGFLWNFLIPLVQILVYILVFTAIFKPGIPHYEIYITAGMIAWIWFSESLQDGSGTLVANGDLLKKIYFPRSVLPITIVLSKTVNFFITLAIFFAIVFIMGFGVSVEALILLPVAIILFLLFMIGCSLLFSALNVFLRDIQYIITVTLMAWVWITPIMYVPGNIDSALLNAIIKINPLTYFIGMFQDILYWKTAVSMTNLAVCAVLTVVALVVGILVFRHLEKDFAEVL